MAHCGVLGIKRFFGEKEVRWLWNGQGERLIVHAYIWASIPMNWYPQSLELGPNFERCVMMASRNRFVQDHWDV